MECVPGFKKYHGLCNENRELEKKAQKLVSCMLDLLIYKECLVLLFLLVEKLKVGYALLKDFYTLY